MSQSSTKLQVGYQKILDYFSLDLRSLALLRICMAIVILADLVLRFSDLSAHYTDYGVVPRSLVLSNLPPGQWSIFFFVDRPEILFVVNGLLAISLLLGFQSRLVTIGCWIFLVSIQVRNPYVNDRGDMTLRLILFWSIFLPLGAKFSIDRVVQKLPRLPNHLVSIPALAYTLQICSIYVFAAIWKSNPDWIGKNGVYYALSVEFFVTAFGQWLLNFPLLLSVANIFVLILEWTGVLLLFASSKLGGWKCRCWAIVLFISLHIGFGLTLELGIFPWISVISWLALIPSQVWDKFTQSIDLLPAKPQKLSIIDSSIVCLLIAIVTWNIASFRNVNDLPYPFRWAMGSLSIWQKWDMFAPLPLAENGWFVIPGTLRNSAEVNLFAEGQPITWEKPAVSSATYANQRWRKYYALLWIEWLIDKGNKSDQMEPYVMYVCRNWRDRHPESEKLVKLQVNFMQEDTLPNYQQTPILRRILKEHQCQG